MHCSGLFMAWAYFDGLSAVEEHVGCRVADIPRSQSLAHVPSCGAGATALTHVGARHFIPALLNLLVSYCIGGIIKGSTKGDMPCYM